MQLRIQPGWRYGAVVLGEGEFEGVLVWPAAPDVWREAGGEIVMMRWTLRLDDGTLIEVQEAELTVMTARELGPQPGPVGCGACRGSGSRPRPGSMARAACPSCGGGGVSYPK